MQFERWLSPDEDAFDVLLLLAEVYPLLPGLSDASAFTVSVLDTAPDDGAQVFQGGSCVAVERVADHLERMGARRGVRRTGTFLRLSRAAAESSSGNSVARFDVPAQRVRVVRS